MTLAIACVAAFISIFYRLVLETVIKKWLNLDTQIIAKQVKLQKDTRLLNKYEFLREDYKKYAALVKGPLTDEQEMANMLSQIEETARKSNVFVSALKPQPVKETASYQRFMVEADIDAAVKDLTAFLYELQNSPKIFKVETMEIKAKPGQGDSVKSHLIISRILFAE